jgi:CBS domain containing-hemolysin-like protein
VVLIGFNGLYVAGEFASVSARKPRIVQMAEDGNRMARLLLPVLQDSHRLDNYIAASQVGITLSSIILGIYGQNTIAPLIIPLLQRIPFGIPAGAAGETVAAGIAATLVLLVLTTLQVVLGELLPKSVAIQYPERIALLTALPMRWSADFLLKPLITLLNGSGRLILRLLKMEAGGEHTHIHSPEEIVILVQESHRSGLLDADERRMLGSVFRVSETTAGKIAVPRRRIVAVEVNEPLHSVLEKAARSAYSRIPIFEGNIDHILGFVHLRDLFSLCKMNSNGTLREILRSMVFVPETVSVTNVWEQMNASNSYMVVVLDEFGGTGGLLTREDIIEELFGELQDEFDQEPPLIRRLSDGQMVVRGELPITTLNDLLETNLPHEAAHTVAGLIEDRLGRIPESGDQVAIQGIRFEVESATNTTVTAVKVFLPGLAHTEEVE